MDVGRAQVDPVIDARLERRFHTFQETTLPYRLLVPNGYHPSHAYPLLLFLHGARWSGSDNVTQLDNEFAVYWVQDSVQILNPGFVVYPQCPSGHSWESVSGIVSAFPPDPELETVDNLLDSLIREFRIDKNRIYIAGKSMGGLGVYGMLSRNPGRFAAAVIVAGNYVFRDISELTKIPLWLLHARFDDVISVEQSRTIVQQFNDLGLSFVVTHCHWEEPQCTSLSKTEIDFLIQQGEQFFYSEFDTSGHQIEPQVVRTYGLHQWTFLQQKSSTAVASAASISSVFIMNYPNPFNWQSMIRYHLPAGGNVQIKVFDIRGREVAHLLEKTQEAGNHQVLFDGRNLNSGIYLAELSNRAEVHRIKMMLLK